MTRNRPDSQVRLLTLLSAVVDGTLSPEQGAALEACLTADPGCRAQYIRYIDLHAELSDRVSYRPSRRSVARHHGNPRARRIARFVRFAAAAVIVVSFVEVMSLLVMLSHNKPSIQAGPPVATLIESDHAVWGDVAAAPSPGSPLAPGFLRLRSGRAQIEFYNGAQVTLTGPCTFGLNSESRAFLRRGRITAYCPPLAHGFTIGAPGVAVVDLGTRFQMDVNPHDEASVRVLEGRVQLQRGRRKFELAVGDHAEVRNDRVTIFTLPAVAVEAGANTLPEPRISGAAVFRDDLPTSPTPQKMFDDRHIMVIPERRVTLSEPVAVDVAEPGDYPARRLSAGVVPTGRTVDVYLVDMQTHHHRTLTATLVFDRPILGVITSDAGLTRTDGVIGRPGVAAWLNTGQNRGMEFPSPDRVTLSQDRKTITVTLSATRTDQLRLLVAAEPGAKVR